MIPIVWALLLTASGYVCLILSGSVEHSLVLGALTALMAVITSIGFLVIDVRLSNLEKSSDE